MLVPQEKRDLFWKGRGGSRGGGELAGMGLEMQDVAAWAREGLSFAIPLFQSLSSAKESVRQQKSASNFQEYKIVSSVGAYIWNADK